MNTALTYPIVAQISDSHLFDDPVKCHHGANVYDNLSRVLAALKANSKLSCIVFTGDLTQDHSENSYQLFAQLVKSYNFDVPFYYVSGNHDDPYLMERYLNGKPFKVDKSINIENWQLVLLDSKSETPAGDVSAQELQRLNCRYSNTDTELFQLVMMHHHAIDVGYFIDRHGLNNSAEFWVQVSQNPSIKGVACGHVHRGLDLMPEATGQKVPLYTCPATSIEFDTKANTVRATGKEPGYRLFYLKPNGHLTSQTFYIE